MQSLEKSSPLRKRLPRYLLKPAHHRVVIFSRLTPELRRLRRLLRPMYLPRAMVRDRGRSWLPWAATGGDTEANVTTEAFQRRKPLAADGVTEAEPHPDHRPPDEMVALPVGIQPERASGSA